MVIVLLLVILLITLSILVIQIYRQEKFFLEIIYKNKKLTKRFNKIIFFQEIFLIIISIIFIVTIFLWHILLFFVPIIKPFEVYSV